MRTWALLLCLAPAACTPGPPEEQEDAGTAACGPGLRAFRTACLPRLDSCGPDEVPLLGGGCKRVGAATCPGGVAAPPDWSCRPVGPPAACLAGWARTAGGWCEPVLPAGSCSKDTMEVIGESTCQPVADCGADAWGGVKSGPKTLFVDGAHRGSSSGTRAQPYRTINAALSAAGPGATVAVAAGTYKEDLAITSPVTIVGRCPRQVTIVGQAQNPFAAVELKSSGMVTLRRLTVTGPKKGIVVFGGQAALDRVRVRDCGDYAVGIQDGATVSVTDALITGNAVAGLGAFGSTVTIERTVIRDGATAGVKGRGIEATAKSSVATPASLTLRDCVIRNNATIGLGLYSSSASLERTVIADTRPGQGGWIGYNVQAGVEKGFSSPSSLSMKDCVVAGGTPYGLNLFGSGALVRRTVIRDTRPPAVDPNPLLPGDTWGVGVNAVIDPVHETPTKLTLSDSLVVNNRGMGIAIESSEATIDRTAVRDNRVGGAQGPEGQGISAGADSDVERASSLVLRDSIVAGSPQVGIAVFSSRATIERSVIAGARGARGTGLQASPQFFSLGEVIKRGSSLEVSDCLVEQHRGLGINLESSVGSIRRTVVQSTRIQAGDHIGGVGLQARQNDAFKAAASLTFTDSLVSGSSAAGVLVSASTARLVGSAVRGSGSMGVQITGAAGAGQPARLTLDGGVVATSRGVGILASGATVEVKRSVIRDTRKTGAGFGDGLQIGSGKLSLSYSLVDGSARAGLLAAQADGLVRGSVFRAGLLPIAFTGEAGKLVVGEDNVFDANQQDQIGRGTKLQPAPPVPTVKPFY